MVFPDLSETHIITTGETEMDSLFVEELHSSSVFQHWLVKKMSLKNSYKFNNAWKSVRDKVGEYDIVVQFDDDKDKIILLIEDKIYSPEQPDQAKRYRKVGKELVKNEIYDKYITCLLSPERYFRKDAPMKDYDERISYEELLEWFKKQPDSERLQHKQMIIENGIKRARTGYQPIRDEYTTNFHNYYRKTVQEIYPEFELGKGKSASGVTWKHMGHACFHPNVKIIHKGKEGYVDLQISKIDKRKFCKWCKGKTEDKMTVKDTNKSISVRFETPKIEDVGKIEQPEKYRKRIVEALQYAERLKNWYLKWSEDPIFELQTSSS